MLAAANGHLDVAQFLVELGADIEVIKDHGRTALMGASALGKTNLVHTGLL
jgi:ankyrin repeat protein